MKTGSRRVPESKLTGRQTEIIEELARISRSSDYDGAFGLPRLYDLKDGLAVRSAFEIDVRDKSVDGERRRCADAFGRPLCSLLPIQKCKVFFL